VLRPALVPRLDLQAIAVTLADARQLWHELGQTLGIRERLEHAIRVGGHMLGMDVFHRILLRPQRHCTTIGASGEMGTRASDRVREVAARGGSATIAL
jgi:hypothetical protein